MDNLAKDFLLQRAEIALRQALESHLGKGLKAVVGSDAFSLKVLHELEAANKAAVGAVER